MTPLILALFAFAADPAVRDVPKPVPATRLEIKAALEAHKAARPRLPLPKDDGSSRVHNARFRAHYLPEDLRGGGFSRDPDPAMTLDPTFKVKLFWVTSRTNNCYYCLGHQEQKLAVAGVSDDDIAALDGDWTDFTAAQRAALAFSRKLTLQPHLVGTDDLAALKRHYQPIQVAEIVLTVAGYNATNRWTDGLNIPAEATGHFFRKANAKVDLKTFQTPTSPAFAGRPSRVAPLPTGRRQASPPAIAPRPPLESATEVEQRWQEARRRRAVLPLADREAAGRLADGAPQWARLLATFPVAGKARAAAYLACRDRGTLPARLKALLAWTAARHDRAWYALDVARRQLEAVGISPTAAFALERAATLPAAERAALAFARKLTVAPAEVTDADVERLRQHYQDSEVAQIVHQICTAAFFNRVTEAARLPLDS